MKKLFISCPMKGRTDENIKKTREKMHKIAEIMFDEELEVIPSFFEGEAPEALNKPVYYLGKSIQMLADADFFIGIDSFYSGEYSGCDVERVVAERYGISSYLVKANDIAPDFRTVYMGRFCGDTGLPEATE